MALEREIKLRFDSADEARERILVASARRPCAGGACRKTASSTPPTIELYQRRCVLRVRSEGGKSLLTFKGPVQPGVMKVREEHETVVADGDALLTILQRARPARLVSLREVPRGVRRRGRRSSPSTRRRSASSSRSKAAKSTSTGPRQRWARRRTTTSPIRIGRCSSALPTHGSSTRATCCSTRSRRRSRRHLSPNDRPVRVAGAGPDRRPGDAPAAAVRRPREGGDAGGRHRHHRAASSAGCATPASGASCSTCIIGRRRSRAVVGDGSRLGPRGALLVGTRTCSDRPAARAARCRCSTPSASSSINGDTLTDCDLRAVGASARRQPGARDDGASFRATWRATAACSSTMTTPCAASARPRSGTRALHFIGVQAVEADVFADLPTTSPAKPFARSIRS